MLGLLRSFLSSHCVLWKKKEEKTAVVLRGAAALAMASMDGGNARYLFIYLFTGIRGKIPTGEFTLAVRPQPFSTMPGTHLLPPNLLKLFAPRPPLPYSRPVDRDIDRVRKKDVDGVGPILARLKEETTNNLFNAANSDSMDTMEEGEEPVFTHAEEVKRQIRREQRKARKEEEFKKAKENCSSSPNTVHQL